MPEMIAYMSDFGRMISAIATALLALSPVLSIIMVEVAFMLVHSIFRLLGGARYGH